jgi:hypothetical protein
MIHEAERDLLRDVMLAISDTTGEGAIFIFAEKDDVKNYLISMDRDEEKMNWAWPRLLSCLDYTILKAMAVRDGATLIDISLNQKKVESRQSTQLFRKEEGEELRGYLVIHDENYKKHWDKLVGKGTRHLNAASLFSLLKSQEKNIAVFTISADGPITPWHDILQDI